ncbi:MAG TPA: holdfast anchoring protein HfaB [Caulobacteraceae bacterium]
MSVGRALAGASAIGLGLLTLSGCGTTTKLDARGNYATPLGAAHVTPNPTPYSGALVCLAEYARKYNLRAPRLAVWRVNDMTGALDNNGGRPVTQGAMLMAITALGKAGIPLVERYETDPSKLEYGLANEKLIKSDSPPEHQDGRGDHSSDYEPIYPGQIDGADYFLTGGITELNSNIETEALNVGASNYPKAASVTVPSTNKDVINIALDLRLVNTKSLDIADIVSYQKQIIGRQVGAGAYAFFGNNVLAVSGSKSQQEPTQLATRSVIERAVFEIVADLYGLRDTQYCLSPAADPLSANVVDGYAAADPPPAQRAAAH